MFPFPYTYGRRTLGVVQIWPLLWTSIRFPRPGEEISRTIQYVKPISNKVSISWCYCWVVAVFYSKMALGLWASWIMRSNLWNTSYKCWIVDQHLRDERDYGLSKKKVTCNGYGNNWNCFAICILLGAVYECSCSLRSLYRFASLRLQLNLPHLSY